MSSLPTEPRVTDITDNVEEAAVAPATTIDPATSLYNVSTAVQIIAKHYEREFPKLSFNTQSQITDGTTVDFIDTSMNVTVATARLRFRNKLTINNETGDMFISVDLSDMSFTKPSVNLTMKKQL